jgi:hypothetical protein
MILMKKTEQIETSVMRKMAFLQENHGFMSPIVNRKRWCTTISYPADEIAIEIELDWRDLDVFVLVTKLENGRLPSGYYVSNGKKCRIHFERVLREVLKVDSGHVKKALGFIPDRSQRDESTLENRLDAYVVLIREYVTELCLRGATLFA